MKKVVVMGGGFAGALIAKKLEHDFDVILIDSKIYFEYTPSILRSVINPKILDKIRVPHKNYLRKSNIIMGRVDEVNKNYVKVGKNKVNYDYLVICSGSNYNWLKEGNNVFISSKPNSLVEAHEKLIKAKRILIIGGGLVGVELAAEICTNFKDKEIILANLDKHLIPRNNLKSSEYAERFLRKYGVKLLLNEKIDNIVDSRKFITKSGEKIVADIAFVSTGIVPNFEFMKKNFSDSLNENNYIKVNSFLQVAGNKNFFAAGDVANINEEKTAQNAEKHAQIVVNNLKALELGGKLKKYEPKKIPFFISLGKYNGIFEYKNFVFTGKIPSLMKWFIEKRTIGRYGKLF